MSVMPWSMLGGVVVPERLAGAVGHLSRRAGGGKPARKRPEGFPACESLDRSTAKARSEGTTTPPFSEALPISFLFYGHH